jgi:hypothetical protein
VLSPAKVPPVTLPVIDVTAAALVVENDAVEVVPVFQVMLAVPLDLPSAQESVPAPLALTVPDLTEVVPLHPVRLPVKV